jgi:hypothetical protein
VSSFVLGIDPHLDGNTAADILLADTKLVACRNHPFDQINTRYEFRHGVLDLNTY